MNILAIDLGKYKSVFCMYQTTTNKHSFGTVNTVPQDRGLSQSNLTFILTNLAS